MVSGVSVRAMFAPIMPRLEKNHGWERHDYSDLRDDEEEKRSWVRSKWL